MMPILIKSTGFKILGISIAYIASGITPGANFVIALRAAQTNTKDIKPTVMKLGREIRTSPILVAPIVALLYGHG